MKKKKLSEDLISRPDIIGWIGFGLQFILSVWTFYYSILPLSCSSACWYIGLTFLLTGFIISFLYQHEHEKVDIDVFGTVKAGKVRKLIVAGIYGKLRHPGYLGAILMQFGMAFCAQGVLPIVLAVFLSWLWMYIAAKEEEYLVKKFKSKYKKYIKAVPWRFIPFVY